MGKRRKYRAASPRETPKTATETPSLIVPTHGHGALLSGGIKVLEEIADNPASSPSDRRAAVDTLGKYAGLQKVEHTGLDDAPVVFKLDLGTTLRDDSE
jgi:hypothetical protein